MGQESVKQSCSLAGGSEWTSPGAEDSRGLIYGTVPRLSWLVLPEALPGFPSEHSCFYQGEGEVASLKNGQNILFLFRPTPQWKLLPCSLTTWGLTQA